jgi:hypothetical protein
MTRKTTTATSRCNEVPEAVREQLKILQARYRSLLAMLPHDPDELYELDQADFGAALDTIELVATEMVRINAAQMAILDDLARQH